MPRGGGTFKRKGNRKGYLTDRLYQYSWGGAIGACHSADPRVYGKGGGVFEKKRGRERKLGKRAKSSLEEKGLDNQEKGEKANRAGKTVTCAVPRGRHKKVGKRRGAIGTGSANA